MSEFIFAKKHYLCADTFGRRHVRQNVTHVLMHIGEIKVYVDMCEL